ncbi:glycosyltransferase family 2 protein [Bifidobacterium dolichotidis]|nr:glycosyltransferase family 2 protein [Bifidobacterium dolichotidis]
MSSTGTTEIQQIIAAALASKTFAHCNRVEQKLCAVITVERDMRFLPYTLEALFSQTVLPQSIIVADCSGDTLQGQQLTFDVTALGEGTLTAYPQTVPISIEIVPVGQARSFGDAVTKALRNSSTNPATTSLWLLHDDSRPADAQCLEHLLDAYSNTPTAAILGAKQLDWEGTHLHSVGAYASHHDVRSLVVDGEPDQEQYDTRSDVYAVSLAGALIPAHTLPTSRGINSWFSTYFEAEDFCRRLCVAGKRVVVVPQARIAHRRARFEGVRTKDGRPLTTLDATDPSLQVLHAHQKYVFSDLRVWMWPFAWIALLIASIFLGIRALFRKRPLRAGCRLLLPWLALINISGASAARFRIRQQTRVSSSALQNVTADRSQIRQWKSRRRAFEDQRNDTTLNPLVVRHLHKRALIRWSLALVAALIAFGVVAGLFWNEFRVGWSGGSLYSNTLLPTGASFSQLMQAATTPWVFGVGTGVPAPPTPWLFVLALFSLFTGGNVPMALSLMFFAAAPIMVLSFWALAGVATRSDLVRTLISLAWFGLALAFGLFSSANLPMLTVFMFLPAAFAFTFKAVGMYRTEQPVNPRTSVQCAAISALLFMLPVAAEPQLLLALVVIFVAFLIFVRRARMMLALIPFPAVFLLAPTLVNSVRYASIGMWRQLFGSVIVPSAADTGHSSAPSAPFIVMRAFGLTHLDPHMSVRSTDFAALLAVAAFLVLAIIAFIALLRPSLIRPSRIVWTVVLCGLLLSLASSSVVVGLDTSGQISGSVLPGMALVALGLLTAVALMAGASTAQFSQFAKPRAHHSASAVATKSVISVLIAASLAACGLLGFRTAYSNGIGYTTGGLPVIAQDYLSDNPDRRVLALSAHSMTSVEYAVMHTSRGDLVDASAAWRVREAFSHEPTNEDDHIADLSARLLAMADDDALTDLSNMGFGGIYVVVDGSQTSSKQASEQLLANLTSTGSARNIVNSEQGSYFRIISGEATGPQVDTAWQRHAESSPWRIAWLWCLGIITALYLVVSIPRRRVNMEGNES